MDLETTNQKISLKSNMVVNYQALMINNMISQMVDFCEPAVIKRFYTPSLYEDLLPYPGEKPWEQSQFIGLAYEWLFLTTHSIGSSKKGYHTWNETP